MIPLWYKRDITFGMKGPDVKVVRRKLGLVEDGKYDRTCYQLVVGMARKAKIDTTGEVNKAVAEALGPAADEDLPPNWWTRPEDYQLQLWDEGDDVRGLVRALGFTDNDNRFHPREEDAVRRLQSSLGMIVNGRVDLDLAKHLGNI
jgi:hypothetical protein